MGVLHCGNDIHHPVGILDDVSPVEHVDHRKPCLALVKGVLNGTETILVLRVVTVKAQMHIIVFAEVIIGCVKECDELTIT